MPPPAGDSAMFIASATQSALHDARSKSKRLTMGVVQMKSKSIVAGLFAACIATGALAITYGVADGTRHPQTGALVGVFSSGTFPYCSGALISPTVFLTAAHCNLGNSRVTVTFDEKYSANVTLHAGTYYA